MAMAAPPFEPFGSGEHRLPVASAVAAEDVQWAALTADSVDSFNSFDGRAALSLHMSVETATSATSAHPPTTVGEMQAWLESSLCDSRAALFEQVEDTHFMLMSETHAHLHRLSGGAEMEFPSPPAGLPPGFPGAIMPVPPPHKMTFKESLKASNTHTQKAPVPIQKKASTRSQMVGRASLAGDKLKAQMAEIRSQPNIYRRMETAVKGQTFDISFVLLIVLNAMVMALQLQYSGLEAGFQLQIRGYTTAADDAWPAAGILFEVLDKCFIVIFALELVLRVLAYRFQWIFSGWNYLDAFVVTMALLNWGAPDLELVNPTTMRLVRFGKLIRLVRVMRSSSLISCLGLMISALKGSVNALFWSLLVLTIIQMVAAMLISQLVEKYIMAESNPLEMRQVVFQYYGTFWRSTITMFEITFANWAPPCRILVDHVSESLGLFFLVYRCLIGFAVLSVVQAVFIQQTIKSAQNDDNMQIELKDKEKSRFADKLKKVFIQLDSSGDGLVSWQEFEAVMENNSDVQQILDVLEVDVRDVAAVFQLLDDGEGTLDSDQFVKGVTSMRGQAKEITILTILTHLRRLESKVDGLPHDVRFISGTARGAIEASRLKRRSEQLDEE